jgi:hypothetical protein
MPRLAILAVILICALLVMIVSGARSFATHAFRSISQAGTVYPLLDARFAYATDLDLRQDSPFDLTDLMQNARDDKVSIQ